LNEGLYTALWRFRSVFSLALSWYSFYPLLNLTLIVSFTVAFTFACELLLVLSRAVSWRVVEYTGGAFGAVLALATAVVTMLAILFRVKS
jgi:hypothetical protein